MAYQHHAAGQRHPRYHLELIPWIKKCSSCSRLVPSCSNRWQVSRVKPCNEKPGCGFRRIKTNNGGNARKNPLVKKSSFGLGYWQSAGLMYREKYQGNGGATNNQPDVVNLVVKTTSFHHDSELKKKRRQRVPLNLINYVGMLNLFPCNFGFLILDYTMYARLHAENIKYDTVKIAHHAPLATCREMITSLSVLANSNCELHRSHFGPATRISKTSVHPFSWLLLAS